MEGLLLVNKPRGVTSHDVVALLRRRIDLRQVGHTGTLDPMAQGLLVLLLGAATKRQRELQGHEKTYDATLTLGTQTDTADATGLPLRQVDVPHLDAVQVSRVLESLVGPLSQTPPAYSAVKVRGKPSYWWARRHQPVAHAPRTVQVFGLSLQGLTEQAVTFRVHCSAGTYIRTLGELIAERLGTVGHLTDLIRLQVGPWSLQGAASYAWLSAASSEDVARRLLPLTACHAGSDRP